MLTKGKPQPPERPRRFYKRAEAVPAEGGYEVRLDGRTVRTPAGARLQAPTQALAELIAAEWQAQGEQIAVSEMPATRLAFTALDRAPEARHEVADEVARYAGSDVLCYYADGPEILVERELSHWLPVLEWAQEALGLTFVRAQGIVHQPQPAETLERVRALALELSDFELTGLVNAAGLYGSAVLAFAVQRDKLGGEAAFELSRLDEAFQEQRWGVDEEAAARNTRLRHEAAVFEQWFRALA
jgi:chaperone required for assembly of F1-ATPase